jgi:hypothetical protein
MPSIDKTENIFINDPFQVSTNEGKKLDYEKAFYKKSLYKGILYVDASKEKDNDIIKKIIV